VRPVRVIDIFLHSSPTLSAPTDSQYLLLSTEKMDDGKSYLRVGEGGNSTFHNSIAYSVFEFFLFSISINTWATRKDSIRGIKREKEEVMHLSSDLLLRPPVAHNNALPV
jgi:hypothetical protein